MNSKRIIIALLALLMAVPIFAQRGYYPNRYSQHRTHYRTRGENFYGLRLGLALANVRSDDSRLDGGGSLAGLNVGGVIGFSLSNQAPVFLETGLYYVQKGGKGYHESKKFTYDLNYLEVPILVKYEVSVGSGVSIQPFAGGYLACGVGGKVKDYGERVAQNSFSEDFFQRFDGGLRLGCGVQYELLYGELSYDVGLANICHSDFDTSHNGCFYLTLGVNF